MQNNAKSSTCDNEAVSEFFQIQLKADDVKAFVDKGEGVHQYFLALEGYTGMDMLFLSEVKIFILIRWKNYKLFEKNLPFILNACPVSDWLKNAVEVIHHPAMLKSFSQSKLKLK